VNSETSPPFRSLYAYWERPCVRHGLHSMVPDKSCGHERSASSSRVELAHKWRKKSQANMPRSSTTTLPIPWDWARKRTRWSVMHQIGCLLFCSAAVLSGACTAATTAPPPSHRPASDTSPDPLLSPNMHASFAPPLSRLSLASSPSTTPSRSSP
jgi:hypothetical protein